MEREGVFLAVSPASLQLSFGIVQKPETLFLIAGNGTYPRLAAKGAREAGVTRIEAAAFEGETDPALAGFVDEIHWMRVGQLGHLITAAKKSGATASMMAGQIAPGNLFDLRPDFHALLLLAKLKERNAETLFGAIAGELEKAGVPLLLATTFLEQHLATEGLFAGPKPRDRVLEDIAYGLGIAKEVSRLDIGQTVVVKQKAIVAIEAMEGTDRTIARGGQIARGGAVVVKTSKPAQDNRFDVPVIGPRTIKTMASVKAACLAIEAGKTLIIDREKTVKLADRAGICIVAA